MNNHAGTLRGWRRSGKETMRRASIIKASPRRRRNMEAMAIAPPPSPLLSASPTTFPFRIGGTPADAGAFGGATTGDSDSDSVAATMVVGPLVKIVMKKVSSKLLDKYKVMKGMEEQHAILKRKLLLILDIIADAEQAAADSEQAAAHRAGVAAWLEDTKKVAYEANEVFDEFKYEALRREAKRNGHYRELGFHVVKLFPTHNRFVFRNRMGRKLCKVVRDIDVLVNEMNAFGFQNQQPQPVINQWREMDSDIFDMKNITGRSRGNDNKNIVDIIVGQADNHPMFFLQHVPKKMRREKFTITNYFLIKV